MYNNYENFERFNSNVPFLFERFGLPAFAFGIFIAVISIWALYWKGRSLWLAAKEGSLKWFIALLIFNTVGVLDIIYIYFFSDKAKGEKSTKHVAHHDHHAHHESSEVK